MNIDIIKGICLTALILAVQVMMLNNIHLYGCCTPFMFVYAIMFIPTSLPRWVPLATGFTLGLVSDSFTNTPGVTSAALTLVAFLQPFVCSLFASRESNADPHPSLRILGTAKYLGYTVLMSFIFCLTFFSLEQFSFSHIQQWALYVGGSTLLTSLLIFTIESLRKG